MNTMSKVKYKTGEKCEISGVYEFYRYTDGTKSPSPTYNEMLIPLSRLETFPPIRSNNKSCWWILKQKA